MDIIDFHTRMNYCFISFKRRNFELAERLANELYTDIINHNYPSRLNPDDLIRCIFYICNIYEFAGERKKSAELLHEVLNDGRIIIDDCVRCGRLFYYVLIMQTICSGEMLSSQDRMNFPVYIKAIERSPDFKNVSIDDRVYHYATKALLAWKSGDYNTLREAQSMLNILVNSGMISNSTDVLWEILASNIAMNTELKNYDIARKYIRIIYDTNEKDFGKALLYLNRKSLNQYLIRNDAVFFLTYSVLNKCELINNLYEIVLNYKNKDSLITSYRNNYKVGDIKLFGEINKLMDIKADVQKNILIDGKDNRETLIDEQLREKEYIYAKNFTIPEVNLKFSTQQIFESMPESSVFIDYIIYFDDIYKARLDGDYLTFQNRFVKIDMYCLVKQKTCTIEKFTIAADIFSILDKYESSDYKEKYSKNLYNRLIKPIENYLVNADILFISPDKVLSNVAFAILKNERNLYLCDMLPIVMINSGRDFVRHNNLRYSDKAMVIGNPKSNLQTAPIPYSELEAHIVAEKLNTQAYIGGNAKCSLINDFKKMRYVHVASHAIHAEEEVLYDIEGWYACALVLAEDSQYSKSLVTADEISRMDLRQTELVVLSVCHGGYTDYEDMASLCSAFRTAGVKYIISTLKGVSDLGTCIFMEHFYNELLTGNIVPVALKKTQNYMRNIDKTKVHNFLEYYTWKFGMCSGAMPTVSDIRGYADSEFWGIFVCTQGSF